MEGIRGFAVLLVFWVHFDTLFRGRLVQNSGLFEFSRLAGILGQSGVDLFFVLSGYLIYGKLIRKPVPYGRFMLRRMQRIQPAFLCILALYLLAHYTFSPIRQIPSGFLPAAVYLLQNVALLPGLFQIPPVFAVAWSLSYEIFFYAAIPLLIGVAGMRRWPSRARCLFLGAAALLYAALHLRFADWSIDALRLLPAATRASSCSSSEYSSGRSPVPEVAPA